MAKLRQQFILLGCLGLVLAFALLFSWHLGAGLSGALLLGLPMLLISYYLLHLNGSQRLIRMGLAMFSGGGIGMLLGCAQDLGPLGLYGLLSLCQSVPVNILDLGQYWQKLQLSPWTYIGMLVGGNLGMVLINGQCRAAQAAGQSLFSVLLVCNAGMLLGMALSEVLMVSIVSLSQPLLAAVLMVLVMLSTMTLGMLLALKLLDNFSAVNDQRVIA
jgi:hypothetical protein